MGVPNNVIGTIVLLGFVVKDSWEGAFYSWFFLGIPLAVYYHRVLPMIVMFLSIFICQVLGFFLNPKKVSTSQSSCDIFGALLGIGLTIYLCQTVALIPVEIHLL